MPRQNREGGDFSFEMLEQLGVIGSYQSGWTKEVNVVAWNGKAGKIDIRDWDPDHEHMSRGITLHKGEAIALLEVLLKNYGHELQERAHRGRSQEVQEASRERAAEPQQTPATEQSQISMAEQPQTA